MPLWRDTCSEGSMTEPERGRVVRPWTLVSFERSGQKQTAAKKKIVASFAINTNLLASV